MLAFGLELCCADRREYKFGDLQSEMANMNTFWELPEAVNRHSGSYSVREVHLVTTIILYNLQVGCPYRKFFQERWIAGTHGK